MTRLGFWLARLRGDEVALQRLSSPVLPDLAGRHVALVGNARSLAQGALGERIDAADLVIRLNAAPISSPLSHGRRTDWIACSMPLTDEVLTTRAPSRVLWMTRKRKRLPHDLAHRPGFYLHPRPMAQTLADALGAPPTTGMMVIDLLALSQARRIELYGFDFFSSLSLSGRRTAADVPHDFAAEKAWVDRLLERDPRIVLTNPLS